jgi:hypothetical protein
MLLAAGHLLLHRAFAERNLGEILGPCFRWLGITEIVILLLCLPAGLLWWRRRPAIPGLCPALVLSSLGLCHVAIGWWFGGGDGVSSQGIVCVYALLFILAGVFFSDDPWATGKAGWWLVIVAILLAAADVALHRFGEGMGFRGDWQRWIHDRYHGDVTYPLAVLVLIPLVFRSGALRSRGAAAIGALFIMWRMLSHARTAPLASMAGALILLMTLGLLLHIRRGRRSLPTRTASRAILLMAVLAGVVYLNWRVADVPQDGPQRLTACSPVFFLEGLEVFDAATLPNVPGLRDAWPRGPGPDDLAEEIFKMHAAARTAETPDARDNLLTILVWRRMLRDWRRKPFLGASLTRPWFYPALAFTRYPFETRQGHDPGNAWVWLLYRTGILGLTSALTLAGFVGRSVWLSYRLSATDRAFALLETSFLCASCFVTFALVGTSLTEPSYAMPFWLTLGMLSSLAGRLAEQPAPGDL